MYKIPKQHRTTIEINQSVQGESIETRIERMLNNNDDVSEMKELIFTREEDGIMGAFNIRHDHWDEAYENASTMAEKNSELDSARLKKRQEAIKEEKNIQKKLKENAKQQLKGGENTTGGEV